MSDRSRKLDSKVSVLKPCSKRKRILGTTKHQVATVFNEEKPALLPLPLEPFLSYKCVERAVQLDGFVAVEAAY